MIIVNEESGRKESNIEGGDNLKHQVSKLSPLIVPTEKYKK